MEINMKRNDEMTGSCDKLTYRAPTLVSYGSIANFTAGGSGAVQENSACNGPNLMKTNKC